jgi:hypothetical protein
VESQVIGQSLVDEVIEKFLRVCVEHLRYRGVHSPFVGNNPDELVRRAARDLLRVPTFVADGHSLSLFDDCNTVSALNYEGHECCGKIVIARVNHPGLAVTCRFENMVLFHEHRHLRKLLEMTDERTHLLSDGSYVFGLGTTDTSYTYDDEDVFQIEFQKRNTWTISCGPKTLLRAVHGRPVVPVPPLDFAMCQEITARQLFGLAYDQNYLYSLAAAMATMAHGGTLVVSGNAAMEADRLRGQSLTVRPFRLPPDLVSIVSSIDGAVLVDPTGTCHAVGVVLDGEAIPGGNRSRGARYNSAYRYVSGKAATVAFVKSDDGMIDLLPHGLAPVRASVVERALRRLQALAKATEVRWRDYHAVNDDLSMLQFHFTDANRSEANELIVVAANKVADPPWGKPVEPRLFEALDASQ